MTGPAYRIHTRRLVLRCWEPADAPLLKAAIDANLEHLRPWMPWAHQEPQDLEAKIALLRRWRGEFDLNQNFVYAIFSRDESHVIGGTGLHTRVGEGVRMIGYWIHQDFINQGLATEVAAALTKVAFEIDQVRRVEIHCHPDNVRSAAIPRKLGYTHEATLRQREWTLDGQLGDMMVWTLLAEEYPGSPASQAKIEALDAIGRKLL